MSTCQDKLDGALIALDILKEKLLRAHLDIIKIAAERDRLRKEVESLKVRLENAEWDAAESRWYI